MQDYTNAAAAELKLGHYTEKDIEAAIKGGKDAPKHGNRLWSEMLTSAHGSAKATKNQDLIEAVEDVIRTVLSPEFTQSQPNGGFDTRNSLGHGIGEALGHVRTESGKPEITIIDRMADKTAYCSPQDPTLNAQIKALKMALKLHAVEQGISLTSSHEVAKPKPVSGFDAS